MQRIGIFLIISILFASCSKKLPSDFKEGGIWKSLENYENEGLFFRAEDKIYGIDGYPSTKEIYKFFKPLPDVDIQSFMVCVGSGYAKDKNRVYYPIVILFFDGDIGGERITDNFIIKGADPHTFKYVGDGYAIDRRNMYLNGEKIRWNDSILYPDLRREYLKKRRLNIPEVPLP